MTFEEYKKLWLESPDHENNEEEIRNWYERGTLVHWCSDLKTKKLYFINSGRKSIDTTYEEERENGILYRTILKYKQEQDKLAKMQEDFV